MATYSATIQLSNGTLTVTRPHPSDDDVDELVDALLYNVRDEDNRVTSIGVTIVTDDTATTPEPPTVDTGQHSITDDPDPLAPSPTA